MAQVTIDTRLLRLAEMDLAAKNYVDYVYMVHRGRWKRSKIGVFICNEVQSFIEDSSIASYSVLLLSLPPQHGKSMSITETLPSWYLGKNPTHRVIEVSYGEDFAKKFGRRNKEKVAEFGEALFGINLATKPNSATEFELSNHVGGMISRGVGGGITGQQANLIVIDDPIKNRADADSPASRNRMASEWVNSIRSRLAARAKVIVIMTRWHEDDFGGWLMQHEPHLKVINIPCECEDAENDPLGRKVGDPLAPEIGKGSRWLKEFKTGFKSKEGARAWDALYQGRPTAVQGNLIKREWWRFYEQPPPGMLEVMSVDCAFKDNQDNDFVAIQCWGKSGSDYYLLDRIKERLDFVGTMDRILYMRSQHPHVTAIYIEDKANGTAVTQILRKEIPGVIPINPAGGKMARLSAVSPAIESGNVYLPKPYTNDYPTGAHWTNEFIEEFAAFPNGAHDDEVDACTQALNRLIYAHSGNGTGRKKDASYYIHKQTPILGAKVNIGGLFSRR